ncbi:heme exporter protein CcmB [Reichenbachiella versicolor]|uniref:heme exporter protein CcmB n=1 Tax=Reichenbachiella versicolor TaxID=1821036 RepID=UPI000D6DEE3B|nr:heme exporter protein CcmB [Reichenbachiella versicolor]
MSIPKEVKTLLGKEVILEWRHKYAINGVLLYTISTIFICYLTFNVQRGGLNPFAWNALFWIIMLFSAVSAISKSFIQESSSRQLYYFNLVKPISIIISKIIYNTIFLVLLSLIAYSIFSLILDNPVQDQLIFLTSVLLGTIGFSISLTLMSGIASKTQNNGMLMAILSFPVVIPLVMMIIKITKNAIDGLDRGESIDEILTLFAIDIIIGALALMLFPYLWRS